MSGIKTIQFLAQNELFCVVLSKSFVCSPESENKEKIIKFFTIFKVYSTLSMLIPLKSLSHILVLNCLKLSLKMINDQA